jgi:preprotein translocase subunit SecG
MVTLLTVLHIFVCVFLILVVLLQPGKAGGMGAAFGGASAAVFGARGATSFLGKLTALCAMVFMLTSIGLSYLATSKEKSLRQEADRQEERAKARQVRPSKSAAKTKAGAMSTPEEEGEDGAEGGGGTKTKAPAKAPAPANDGEGGGG